MSTKSLTQLKWALSTLAIALTTATVVLLEQIR
jgi:hypothetical protein